MIRMTDEQFKRLIGQMQELEQRVALLERKPPSGLPGWPMYPQADPYRDFTAPNPWAPGVRITD